MADISKSGDSVFISCGLFETIDNTKYLDQELATYFVTLRMSYETRRLLVHKLILFGQTGVFMLGYEFL